MVRRLMHGLGGLCFITSLVYIYQAVFPSDWAYTTFSIMAGVLLAFAIFFVRRSSRVAALLLICAGTIIFVYHDVRVIQMVQGLGQNINLLTLFLVVPFIGVVMSIGGYLTALKQLIQEQEQDGQAHPYRLSSILIGTMGFILNLGVLPITQRIAEESFSSYEKKKMGMVMLRAFNFCVYWSPYFVNVGLVVVLFDVSWFNIGWAGFVIALVYLLISALFFRLIQFENDSKHERRKVNKPIAHSDAANKIKALIIWSISLFIASVILDLLVEVNMLTIVSILALVYPLIWAGAIGVLKEYLEEVVKNIFNAFERLKNEIAVFISAGYFGVALSYTEAGEWASSAIFALSFGSVYLMSVLIISFSVVLALVGIHPVIVLIGVGSSLSPALFGVSPEFMALVLILAWAMSTSVSPFSGSVLMTSALINESPWTVSQKNWLFNGTLMLILPLVLYLMFVLNLI